MKQIPATLEQYFSLAEYEVIRRLNHDNTPYLPGDTVWLPKEQAIPLLVTPPAVRLKVFDPELLATAEVTRRIEEKRAAMATNAGNGKPAKEQQ